MKKYASLGVGAFMSLLCSCHQETAIQWAGMLNSDEIIDNIAQTSFASDTVQIAPSRNRTSCRKQDLQQAIDSCSAQGGGVVNIAPGFYSIHGPLLLKSNVNLHLCEGAYVQFSGIPNDFLPVVLTRWEGTEMMGHCPMIYAFHADNIAITGKGTIDAQGGLYFAPWASNEMACRDSLRAMGDRLTPVEQRIFGEGTNLRPSCIQPFGCSRVLIEGITVKDSPFWTLHPVYCDNVIVRGVTIDSHFPNNDGCDPESTTNVLIENCTFKTGDDAVAIKSGRDADGRTIGKPSKNIIIRNCDFQSECNGLCIGSEMSGGVANVYMNNITIGTVKNALYFKSNKDRGGYIRNIIVDSIRIERALGAILRFETNYFGFRGGNHQAKYDHFRITNVRAEKADNYAIFMDGNEDQKIDNIEIKDFVVNEAKYPYYLKNTEQVTFENSSINGEPMPYTPKENEETKTLNVY